MRKFLIGLGVVVVLLVVAAFVVPMVIPTETYKKEIAEAVKDATGRDLVIKGDVKVSILPTLGATVKDVSFANAPGGKAKHMATFKELVVEVKLFPLISGNVEVDRFVLVEPVINLEVDKSGRGNWAFTPPSQASGKGSGAGAPKPDAKAAPRSGSGEGGGASGLRLGDVRLVKGTVTYTDLKTGVTHRIDNANLAISFPSLASPISVDGDLVWNKEKIAIKARVDKPQAVTTGGSTPARLSIQSNPVKLAFAGSVKGGKAGSVGGTLDLDIPSVRSVFAWIGSPMPPGGGFGPFKIKGGLAANAARVGLTKATIVFDEITAKGDIGIAMGKGAPTIVGNLDVGKLDLNPYVGGGKSAGGGQSGGAKAGGGAPAGGGKAASSGWSREKIDTTPLRMINADLTLSAASILYQKIKVGQSKLKVALRGGRLQADLQQLTLYGGKGTGQIVLDGRKGGVAISQNFTLSGLNIRPFLTDVGGYSGLSGTGATKIRITGRGASQYDIVKSLNGGGSFNLRNGAIKGVSFIGLVCSFNPAQLLKGQGQDKETKFSEFNGIYVIRNGVLTVAKYEDMRLKSPLLRLSAKGSSPLPPRTLDFRIEPKIVGSCKGQGSTFTKAGVAIPLFVKGTWDNPKFEIDTAALTKIGPDAIKKGAEALKEGPKGIKKSIEGLLGGAKKGDGAKTEGDKTGEGKESPAKTLEGGAKKLLKGLGQ